MYHNQMTVITLCFRSSIHLTALVMSKNGSDLRLLWNTLWNPDVQTPVHGF